MTLSEFVPGDRDTAGRGEFPLMIREFIDHHVTENFSLEKIATRYHLSKRHLIRVFKDSFGVTPGLYHTKARLAASTHYLCEANLTIGEIAVMFGFCDQSCYAATFKKYYGRYPSAYRRENRG